MLRTKPTTPCFNGGKNSELDPYLHFQNTTNKLTKDTVDMRGTTETDGLLLSLAQYCIKHPHHSFSRSVESLITALYPKRMTHMPQ